MTEVPLTHTEPSHTHERKDSVIEHTHPGGYYHPHYHSVDPRRKPIFWCECVKTTLYGPPTFLTDDCPQKDS